MISLSFFFFFFTFLIHTFFYTSIHLFTPISLRKKNTLASLVRFVPSHSLPFSEGCEMVSSHSFQKWKIEFPFWGFGVDRANDTSTMQCSSVLRVRWPLCVCIFTLTCDRRLWKHIGRKSICSSYSKTKYRSLCFSLCHTHTH